MPQPSLPKYGLGTSRIASMGESLSQPQVNQLILASLEGGISGIDTADTYGSGDSERRIGTAIAGRRSDFFLMSKAGLPYVALPAIFTPLNQVAKKLRQKLGARQNFSKAYLLASIRKSLKRLGTDHLDVFFLHEPEVELRDETFAALQEIRSLGLSRWTGVSTDSPNVVAQALASGQVQAVQTPVSFGTDAREILQLCQDAEVPVIANQVFDGLELLNRHAAAWSVLKQQFQLAQTSDQRLLIEYAAAQPAVAMVLFGTGSEKPVLQNVDPLAANLAFPDFRKGMDRMLA